jgi:carbamoyl-phosphate synthase large subunit
MNVLITAGSRRVPLVQAFQAALLEHGSGTVVVTDVDPSSPSVHAADRCYRVPYSNDPEYVDALIDICLTDRIGLVVPTVDDELEVVARARRRFCDVGATVACSPTETAAICNDKYRACLYLRERGVDAAQSWLPEQLPDDPPDVLFIKPRRGRGSVGAHLIRNRREREFFLTYVNDPVVQEFLQAPEYTIDMLCDWHGTPLSIVPRERTVIRAGVSDRGRTLKHEGLMTLAQRVADALPFHGPVNIQCRMRGATPVVIEINPRFSGGIPLTIAAGADFASMLLQLARGDRLQPALGQFRADLWMTKYDAAIFLAAERMHLPALSSPAMAWCRVER